MVKVLPSMLSANFAELAKELADIEQCGADMLHIDVMDGHFVPNLTFGAPIVKAIRPYTTLPFDVHFMVTNPETYIDEYADIGVEYFTFHVEAAPHAHRLIQQIKSSGMKAGVALNPSTPVGMLENIINDLDMVLIMSVNPGYGGQSFIPRTIDKIKQVSSLLKLMDNTHVVIEVDGGINTTTCEAVKRAGAELLVAGSAVFGARDRAAVIKQLKV